MTENHILIFAVFLAFLIASAISSMIIYRQTNLVLKDNDKLKEDNLHLANEVKFLKEQSEAHNQSLNELQERLKSKDRVAELQQQTESLREKIKNTQDMSDEELRAWIEVQVTSCQLFRDPNLNIKTMAQKLGLTQKKVREFLKASHSNNFHDYLTEKRVLHACELIKENQQWSMDAVSKEAGFVSRTTFQTEFKKRIGVTPAQYRHHTQLEGIKG